MAKIGVLTGSGISVESGIPTFRGKTDSLYDDNEIMSLISSDGLKFRKAELYSWINKFKEKYGKTKPNAMHEFLALLEDAIIVTQNVDELHEKAGSTNVIHLHGNVNEYITTEEKNGVKGIVRCEGPYEVNATTNDGFELRPNVVLFNEYPYGVELVLDELSSCEIIIVVGTSFEITYLHDVMSTVSRSGQDIIIINPEINRDLIRRIFYMVPEERLHLIEKTSCESIVDLGLLLKALSKKKGWSNNG